MPKTHNTFKVLITLLVTIIVVSGPGLWITLSLQSVWSIVRPNYVVYDMVLTCKFRNCDSIPKRWCMYAYLVMYGKARIFLLVDLREFFFRFRVEGTKKTTKKL